MTSVERPSFRDEGDTLVLTNGLCRIVWCPTAEGWSAEFQLNAGSAWQTVAHADARLHGLEQPPARGRSAAGTRHSRSRPTN